MDKACSKCKQAQPTTEFPRHKHAKDGLSSWCKTCRSVDKKRYYRANRPEIAAKGSIYGKRKRECPEFRRAASARMKAWREKNVKRVRANNIARYGLTLEEFEMLFDAQEGQCAICSLPLIAVGGPQKNEKAHIDHDHATGHVRGLLCGQCNLMLGAAKDRPEVLRRAADYLQVGG